MHRFLYRLMMASIATCSMMPCVGCIELEQLITGQDGSLFGSGDSALPTDGASNGGGGIGTGDLPVVSLRASNTSPAANEEILLTCLLRSGDREDLVFSFQPRSARIVVDRSRGTARIVVTEADIGASFTFTCSATNAAGTGSPSNAVLIIPFAQP